MEKIRIEKIQAKNGKQAKRWKKEGLKNLRRTIKNGKNRQKDGKSFP